MTTQTTKQELKLFVVLLGGKQFDDTIEAHNLFVGIGTSIESLVPKMKKMWKGGTHIDAYMALEYIENYKIHIMQTTKKNIQSTFPKLFILNIGYYMKGQFAELHKIIPFVSRAGENITTKLEKSDIDFRNGQELGKTSRSHIDDKHEVLSFDIDDIFDVGERMDGYEVKLVEIPEEELSHYPPIEPITGYLKFSKFMEEKREFPWRTFFGIVLIIFGSISIWYGMVHPTTLDPLMIWIEAMLTFCIIAYGFSLLKKK